MTADDNTQVTQDEAGDANTQTLTFRISEELAEKIAASAAAAKMNRSVLLRLAVDRGIDRLLEQLEIQPAAEQ
jgi:predicted transcriptional regulator